MALTDGIAKLAYRHLKTGGDVVLGWAAVGALQAVRACDRKRTADFAAATMRALGPRLKEHEVGRANLVAAFPEKSAPEIEAILRGVWDNLGRVGAEFAHIDRLRWFPPPRNQQGDIVYTPDSYERLRRVQGEDKPALFFAAHLANWEVPSLVAMKFGLDATVLYRRPNIRAISDAVIRMRKGSMGTMVSTGFDAPLKLARVLEAGGHVAMLVDQHYVNGTDVTFFGRRCKVNPLIAHLARLIECPIYGTRAIRLPDRHHFSCDFSETIEPMRDADGRINIEGTMQAITRVVESWVREYPDQWLWVHRRWR